MKSRQHTTRRVRLKGFDYRTPGYFFLTVCQKDRLHLFSRINNGVNELTPSGKMIAEAIHELQVRFRNVAIDCWVIMPNHIYLLIGMNLNDTIEDSDCVIDVMHWWKTITTNKYGWRVRSERWPRYQGALWQEGYHDRIVRDQRELEYIRYYIEQNPRLWSEDTVYDGY